MESIESKIPPRPGIILPESFIPDERLNTDSVKSPTIEESAMQSPVKTILRTEPEKICGHK